MSAQVCKLTVLGYDLLIITIWNAIIDLPTYCHMPEKTSNNYETYAQILHASPRT